MSRRPIPDTEKQRRILSVRSSLSGSLNAKGLQNIRKEIDWRDERHLDLRSLRRFAELCHQQFKLGRKRFVLSLEDRDIGRSLRIE